MRGIGGFRGAVRPCHFVEERPGGERGDGGALLFESRLTG